MQGEAQAQQTMKMDRPKPYAVVATFCENVIEGKDGTLSLIRVVDNITVTLGPDHERYPPLVAHAVLATILRSGEAQGLYTLKFILRPPSGEERQSPDMPIEFTGEERGINIRAEFVFPVTMPGLYWVDLMVDGEKLTSVPLRLIVQTQTHPQ